MKKEKVVPIEVYCGNVEMSSELEAKSGEKTEAILDEEQSITEDIIVYGKTSFIAWIELLVCICVNCTCGMSWSTFASAPLATSEWMNVSLTKSNGLSSIVFVVNTIVSLISPYIHAKCGIKYTILLSGSLNSLGCWIRCISTLLPVEMRYPVIVVGQIIAASGGPPVYTLSTKFSSVWLAPQHRGIATNLLSLSFGSIVAPLLIPAIATSAEYVPKMLVTLAVISTIFPLPMIFLPSKPRIPPSKTSTIARTSLRQGIKQISRNINFWWIIFVASISFGMIFTISAILVELIVPHGYTERQGGICSCIMSISGLVSGGMHGYWIGKTGQHFMLIKIFAPLSIFTYIMFIFQMIPNSFATVLITCILYGFFTRGMTIIYLEIASEVSYPVSESVPSSVIWTLNGITSVIFTTILDSLRAGPDANPPYNMNKSMIAAAIIMVIGNLPVLWIKGNLNRLKKDKEGYNPNEEMNLE